MLAPHCNQWGNLWHIYAKVIELLFGVVSGVDSSIGVFDGVHIPQSKGEVWAFGGFPQGKGEVWGFFWSIDLNAFCCASAKEKYI